MRNQETPQPDEGTLSTDDLAATRQGTGGEAPGSPGAPPEFPGEATTIDREAREEDAGRTSAGERRGAALADENEPLLGDEQEEFRTRWQKIQSNFVDDPQDAVNAADRLVAETMQALATTFSDHKRGLEGQWHRGEEVATEDLRVALQRYRSFFNRLLST
ncbi:hypothetical protein [Streptomyces griseocarneus]|uniref:hypothetical protein n=1 Tax=Streptomyces griseocarneus TaxID=51201 RepID=UPI00167D5540|nr:hypothetical protein [Streptomyces griseocarneus]MBZ6474720.1 hypothetical protein [Streptomyces griseocarneus]GHG47779.1 hypothetical protein GCM10018779_05360 [Streptomyces griseocarneus]